MPKTTSTTTSAYPSVVLILSLAAVLLGIYQWIELLQWRSAGHAPLCNMGQQWDCSKVWDSPLSNAIHRITGIPLPGWGIIWAAATAFLSARVMLASRAQQSSAQLVQALRLFAMAGVLVVIALLGYSIAIATFCLTCITFYVLVLLIAYYCLRHLNPATSQWGGASIHAGLPLAVLFALVLYPGIMTPRHGAEDIALAEVAQQDDQHTGSAQANPIARFLSSLPEETQQAVAQSLAIYRSAPRINHRVDPSRLVYGTDGAPVHIVEWIDIRCPHCRRLDAALQEIREIAPPGSWSLELRHFPLDEQCNSVVRRDEGGISCLAAKLLICLSGSPEANTFRHRMFEQQKSLTREDIWQLTGAGANQRTRLEQCVAAKQTEIELQQDIRMALQHKLEGTPLVVINGKKGTSVPAFIYSLIVAMGRENDPGFQVLPAAAGEKAN